MVSCCNGCGKTLDPAEIVQLSVLEGHIHCLRCSLMTALGEGRADG